MKKLIISATGFPVTSKTLRYLQENTNEAIKGLLGNYEDHRVIWGMTINPTGTAISEGAFTYQSEAILFPGGDIDVDSTITINESVENAPYNTNPSNKEYTEILPAYVSRVASIGVGGVHTFPVSALKHYSEQVVIASGVTIFEGADPIDGMFTGAVFCEHRTLTNSEFENSMIVYSLTRYNGTTSYMSGASHNLLYRFVNRFAISIDMPLSTVEKPLIQWQIVKFKK